MPESCRISTSPTPFAEPIEHKAGEKDNVKSILLSEQTTHTHASPKPSSLQSLSQKAFSYSDSRGSVTREGTNERRKGRSSSGETIHADSTIPKSSVRKIPIEMSYIRAGPSEDTFVLHLRDCQGAREILTLDSVLRDEACDAQNNANVASDVEKITSTDILTSGQILGGFASLGQVAHKPKNSFGTSSSRDDASLSPPSTSLATSPISLSDDGSPWTILTSSQGNPGPVLDVLSIDEMGLHSIDVGSPLDWQGTLLSCPFHHHPTVVGWQIARSRKRHNKWIVTPAIPCSERTIIVSKCASSHRDFFSSPSHTTDDEAIFNLRFLQAGSSAPSLTVQLAHPSAHNEFAIAKLASENLRMTASCSSLGLHEEYLQNSTLARIRPNDDPWPSLRLQAAVAATQMSTLIEKQKEPTLTHSRSASTIVARSSVHLESRRPSLGKSVSHEGLEATGSVELMPTGKQVSKTWTETRTPLTDNLAKQPFFSRSQAPFGDYHFGSQPKRMASPSCNDCSLSPHSSTYDFSCNTGMESEQNRNVTSKTSDPAPISPTEQSAPVTAKLSIGGSQTGSNGRRDRRIGEWFRRKVLPHNHGAQLHFSKQAPLPPAWEPTGDPSFTRQSSNCDSGQTKITSSVPAKFDNDIGENGQAVGIAGNSVESAPNELPSDRDLRILRRTRTSNEADLMFPHHDWRRRSSSADALMLESKGIQKANSATYTDASIPMDSAHDSKAFSPGVLGLEGVPESAMTFIVPLPLASEEPDIARDLYVRISFVPFHVESHSSTSPQEHPLSFDDVEICQTPGPSTHTNQSTWYQRLANAWAHTSSNHITDEESRSYHTPQGSQYTLDQIKVTSKGSYVGSPFRVTARVFRARQHGRFARHDSRLPQPFSFPVILGICDGKDKLEFLPEGWQAIGLSDGPVSASIGFEHPLFGLADLIVSGCVVCMNL